MSGLAALAVAGVTGRAAVARYYDGPVSDHFDGTYFIDPHGTQPKSIADLVRWWGSRSSERWPAWAPSPYRDHPPPRVDGGTLRISYVGHASLLLQTAGRNILIDPVWSERASPFAFAGPKRVNEPGIALEALPPIDAVLVSHAHDAIRDHCRRVIWFDHGDLVVFDQDGDSADSHFGKINSVEK